MEYCSPPKTPSLQYSSTPISLRYFRYALARGFHREFLFQPPMRDLTSGGEPYALVRLHVADDLGQYLRAAGPAGNIRMKLKRAKSRRRAGLFVELIEHPLPDH